MYWRFRSQLVALCAARASFYIISQAIMASECWFVWGRRICRWKNGKVENRLSILFWVRFLFPQLSHEPMSPFVAMGRVNSMRLFSLVLRAKSSKVNFDCVPEVTSFLIAIVFAQCAQAMVLRWCSLLSVAYLVRTSKLLLSIFRIILRLVLSVLIVVVVMIQWYTHTTESDCPLSHSFTLFLFSFILFVCKGERETLRSS